MGLISAELFEDRVYITITATGAPLLLAAPTCFEVDELGNRAALNVAEIGFGWYEVTNLTPNADGTWSTEWAVAGANTIHYPYKIFKVGGGQEAVILADTNELQTDWADGGRLDLLLDGIIEDIGVFPTANYASLAVYVEDIRTRLIAIDADTGTIVWGDITGIVADIGVFPTANYATIAAYVEDIRARLIVILADVTGLNGDAMRGTDNAATEAKQDIIDANVDLILVDTGTTLPSTLTGLVVLETTIGAANRGTTTCELAAGSDNNDAYNGMMVVLDDDAGDFEYVSRTITSYTGATKTVVWSPAITENAADGGKIWIVSASPLVASSIATILSRVTAAVATEAKQDVIDGYFDVPVEDAAGDTTIRDVVGKKTDTVAGTSIVSLVKIVDVNVDDIETDTSDMQPRVPRITCSMDFWSNLQEEAQIGAGDEAGVIALPDVVVADLPAGITITRAYAMYMFRALENTNAGANAVDVAGGHIEVRDDGPGVWTTAIDIPDNSFGVAGETREMGTVVIGDNDISGEVDGNDTYEFEFDDIGVDQDFLNMNDVQTGLRIYFTV